MPKRKIYEIPLGNSDKPAHTSSNTYHENPKKLRRVKFTKDTKKYDDICNMSNMFVKYMENVLSPVKIPIEDNIVNTLVSKNDILTLTKLHEMLVDLIHRCETSPNNHAVILPRGARRYNKMIHTGHIEHLQKHSRYLGGMIANVQNIIDQRNKCATTSETTPKTGDTV